MTNVKIEHEILINGEKYNLYANVMHKVKLCEGKNENRVGTLQWSLTSSYSNY